MSADMHHAAFPSDETLAAFIDGQLDEETRKRVVEHMSACAECRDVLVTVRELSSATAAATDGSPFRRYRSIVIAAALAAAAMIVVAIVGRSPWRHANPSTNGEIAALSGAAPPYRNFDGRVAGLDYRPLEPVTRGGGDKTDSTNPDYWQLWAVAAKVRQEAQRDPSAANLHALGISHLMVGNWSEAVAVLESAVRKETGEPQTRTAIARCRDAALLNDLAAAYLAYGRHANDPARFVTALDCSQRAWTLAQTPEIAWNRALSLESLRSMTEARLAWREYIGIERDPRWAAEAHKHLDHPLSDRGAVWEKTRPALDAALVRGDGVAIAAITRRFPKQVFAVAEDELLSRWSAADAPAAAVIEAKLQQVGVALDRVCGDRFIADVAASLAAPAPLRGSLAAAHARYAEARTAYRNHDLAAAREPLAFAISEFRSNRSPFAYEADVLAASCAYYGNRFDEADAMTSDILRRLPNEPSYHFVHAHALWIRGTTRGDRGLPLESIRDHENALSEYATLGDADSVTGLQAALAHSYEVIGDANAAWHHRLAALGTASENDGSIYVIQLLLESASAAIADGETEAARTFLDRELQICTAPQWSNLRVLGYLWRAEILDGDGRRPLAHADRRAAVDAAAHIQDPEIRRYTSTSVEFVRAQADASGADEGPFVDAALRFARERRHHFRMAELLLEEAQACERRGDGGGARNAVDDAVDEIEQQRASITSRELRASFTDAQRLIYDEAIRLAMRSADPTRAFVIAERSRARILSESVGGVAPGPERFPTPATVSRALPPRVLLVEFRVLPRSIVIWAIRHDAVHVYEHATREGEVSAAVARFGRGIADDDAGAGAPLFALTVAPWLRDGAAVDAVAFVADADLVDVPFAALGSGDGHVLVERFRICNAPSAGLFLPGSPTTGGEQVVVAAPGAGSESDLSPLRGAASEARAVAAMYSAARLLQEREATRERFLAAGRNAGVIHFAGHAVAGRNASALSALVFRDGESPSYLYARDIAAADFRRTRLVVLAACATNAASAPERGGSVSGLTRAFLAAGAHGVVGTLWPVDDDAAARFAVALHARLRAGDTPPAALRAVQLALLRRMPPRDWAAFTFSGRLTDI